MAELYAATGGWTATRSLGSQACMRNHPMTSLRHHSGFEQHPSTTFCLMLICWRTGGRLVKDTSAWSNKREALEQEQAALQGVEAGLAELNEQGIAARIATAAAARDEAQADCARHAAKPPCCRARCVRLNSGQIRSQSGSEDTACRSAGRRPRWKRRRGRSLARRPATGGMSPTGPCRNASPTLRTHRYLLSGVFALRLAVDSAKINACGLRHTTSSPWAANFAQVGDCLQTTAEGEAKAADVAAKHLAKQLADTQKALAAKQSSAGKLQQVSSGHHAGLAV